MTLVSEVGYSNFDTHGTTYVLGIGTFSYVSSLVIYLYLKDLMWSLQWQEVKLSKCLGLVINSYSSQKMVQPKLEQLDRFHWPCNSLQQAKVNECWQG